MNKSNELCNIGQELWDNVREEYNKDKYKKYVDHIKFCKECKKGLEIWRSLPDWDKKILVANVHKIVNENENLRKKYFDCKCP